jgi:para-aminobenzoate synthetase component 1
LIFFDSAGGPAHLRRYSYVSADPFLWLRQPASNVDRDVTSIEANAFHMLARHSDLWKSETIDEFPPFQGGMAGLFSYSLNQYEETIPSPQHDEFQIPDLMLAFYDWVYAYDHWSRRGWFIATGFPEFDCHEREKLAASRIHQIKKWLFEKKLPSHADSGEEMRSPAALIQSERHPLPGFRPVISNFSRAGYERAVRQAIEHIHAGDCFQINLSQRLLTPLRESPLEIYGRLRRTNPAPFGAYFDAGDFQIMSASPERFLSLSSTGEVCTRPIKGTRRRGGGTPEEEFALQDDLLRSEKDRAENVMIVDLMRNDLGRVCEYGSIHVTKLCELETYATVHHLVSEVRGQLRAELRAADLLRAAFPGGSVTGAPKIRAMQIIGELERVARGAYCGCLGWIGFDGAMDTSILIRTMTASRGWIQFPVGGGIVADSDPAREYEETLHKAEGTLRALEEPIAP